jgi:phosphate starvation-inducible PhoH-like protein
MGKQKERLPEKQSVLVRNFEPKNDKQAQFVKLIKRNEVVIAKGTPGSGKTYVSLAVALSMLGQVYKKVIIVKSVTTLPGEEIGFLKGSQDQKMEPFMMSFTWNIDKICGEGAAKALMDKGLVQVLPLAFVRGISIDNAIVIFDELQNTDLHTFKTMMTRIGTDSKYILLGDSEQIDRKKKAESCLDPIIGMFKDSPFIGTIEFTDEDCVRNPIIPKILEVLRNNGI